MKKAIDWVVVGGKVGETAHCQRCGEGLNLGYPVRVEVFTAATKAFEKSHSHCKENGWKEPAAYTATDWAQSRDTGVSSFTIWSVMTGMPSPWGTYDVPHDPADFGRCYRLFNLFPSWKLRLNEVAKKYPAWEPFVQQWNQLTKLYEGELRIGKCPQLYAAIQKIEHIDAQLDALRRRGM